MNYCPISASEKIVIEFLAFSEGSSERNLIERRYGRAHVKRLVARYQEEQLNKQWLESSTTSCPGCDVKVEKSLGCNHVSPFHVTTVLARKLMCTPTIWRSVDDLRQVQNAFL